MSGDEMRNKQCFVCGAKDLSLTIISPAIKILLEHHLGVKIDSKRHSEGLWVCVVCASLALTSESPRRHVNETGHRHGQQDCIQHQEVNNWPAHKHGPNEPIVQYRCDLPPTPPPHNLKSPWNYCRIPAAKPTDSTYQRGHFIKNILTPPVAHSHQTEPMKFVYKDTQLESSMSPPLESSMSPTLESLESPPLESLKNAPLDSLKSPLLESLKNAPLDSLKIPPLESLMNAPLESLKIPLLDSSMSPSSDSPQLLKTLLTQPVNKRKSSKPTHLAQVLIIPKKSPVIKKLIHCDFCKREFVKKHSLKNHIMSKHSKPIQKKSKLVAGTKIKRLFHCEICKSVFAKKRLLKDHICSQHLNLKSRLYQCSLCVWSFSHYHLLLQHKRTIHRPSIISNDKTCHDFRTHGDSTTRGFECHECGKVLTKKDDLKRHALLHQADRPIFECVDCDKKFSRKETLREHQIRGHEEEVTCRYVPKLECPICDRGFLDENNYKKHIEYHKGEIFKCEYCRRTFLTEESKSEHIRSNHGDFVKSSACVVYLGDQKKKVIQPMLFR